MSRTIVTLAALAAAFTAVLGTSEAHEPTASASLVLVDGQTNVFGAGHSVVPAPLGGPGLRPISFAVTEGSVLTFPLVTGEVAAASFAKSTGPDGGVAGDEFGGTNLDSVEGISGIVHSDRNLFLMGVFTGDAEPTNPAPERLVFTNADDFVSLSADLHQSFFIGDGLTGRGRGEFQRFVVPAGATKLWLGFADGFDFRGDVGSFSDNSGQLRVSIQPFEEAPTQLTTLAITGLKAKVRFDKPEKDTIALKAEMDLPESFDVQDKSLDIDIGGVHSHFEFDARGKASSDAGTAKLKVHRKTRTWRLTLKLKRGQFAASLRDEGLTNETLRRVDRRVRALLTMDGETFLGVTSGRYTSRRDKTGRLQ